MPNHTLALGVALALVAVPAKAELALELSATAATHQLGEPISVAVTLTNTGSTPEQVLKDLAPEYHAVRYTIRRPNGEEVLFSPWAVKEPAEPFATLAPGESIAATAKLFFDGNNWIFTEPGRYVILARYVENLDAQPLTLDVAAPPNDAASDAATTFLQSPEAGLFLLLGGGNPEGEGARVLAEVADTAEGTVQATHANLALGLSRTQDFADFAAEVMRPADPAAAVERLEQVNVEQLDFAATAEARLGLADAYRALNAPDRALEVQESLEGELQRRFPQIGPDLRDQLLPQIEQNIRQ